MSVSVDFAIRDAIASDADFLRKMLIQAVNWDTRRMTPEAEILASPLFTPYFADWPQEGDVGLVAIDDDEPIGAAWFRSFVHQERGLGRVADDIPVIAIGVAGSWQNRGVGRALLRALVDKATSIGYRAVSLSVDPASFAARVSRSEGFEVVHSESGNRTMLKTLSED